MISFVAGADRTGLRLVLLQDSNVISQEYIASSPIHRNERRIIEVFLESAHESWGGIDRFVVLQLPHSHTSVRVMRSLLSVAAWYYGQPMHSIACEQLAQYPAEQLTSHLADLE